MKLKEGMSVIWLFLKIPRLMTTSMESSRRDLFIDMAAHRFIIKNKQLRSPLVSPSYIPFNRCGTTYNKGQFLMFKDFLNHEE